MKLLLMLSMLTLAGPLVADADLDLQKGAEKGDTKLILKAVRLGADIEAQDDDGYSPLMLAAKAGQTKALQALVNNGAKVNTAHKGKGSTALHLAAAADDDKAVRFLIEQDAKLEAKDGEGRTPLRSALDARAAKALKVLLQNSADGNTADKQGLTPFMVASKNGDLSTVKSLLKNGAKASLKTKAGDSALSLATAGKHTPVVDYLLRKAGGQSSERKVGSLGAAPAAGKPASQLDVGSALLEACAAGSLGTARSLLAAGADPNEEFDEGWTPLLKAISVRNDDLVSLLLQNGADPNQVNELGMAAVEFCLGQGSRTALKALFLAGGRMTGLAVTEGGAK